MLTIFSSHPFIQHMCDYQLHKIQHHPKSVTILNTGHSWRMLWVLLTGVTSTMHPLPLSAHLTKTVKVSVHRTVSSVVTLALKLSMLLQDGRGQLLMHVSMKMHVPMTWRFWLANTTLLMQGFHSAMSSLSYIEWSPCGMGSCKHEVSHQFPSRFDVIRLISS